MLQRSSTDLQCAPAPATADLQCAPSPDARALPLHEPLPLLPWPWPFPKPRRPCPPPSPRSISSSTHPAPCCSPAPASKVARYHASGASAQSNAPSAPGSSSRSTSSWFADRFVWNTPCLLYTSPSPRDAHES
eukprot:2627646-Prymnesium_polylepis.1